MSSLETRKIEPQSGTTVTLGAAGDGVTAGDGATIKTNTVKDAGGNTIFTSDGAGTLSSVNSALAGSMIFISSQTANSSASLDFTSGIDSTYDEYVFCFVNMNPATDNASFRFQVNAVGQTGFNETITSSYFATWHDEADTAAGVGYITSHDQAQGTGYQIISYSTGNGADEGASGVLHIFAPSSTTYVKQFYSRASNRHGADYAQEVDVGGYINTTSAINQVSFDMSSGNITAGTVYMYGIN